MSAGRLLQNRTFRAFLLAYVAERLAASALAALLGFQVYAITRDPLDLGWLGLVEAIPGVSLVLYGGHVADRHRRRRIVLFGATASALLAAGLGLASAHGAALPVLFVAAFLTGVVNAFADPALSGLEAHVVPVAQLMPGLSLLATSARLATMVGPAAGGVLWGALGATGTYPALAAVFLVAAGALLLVPEPPVPAHVDDTGAWRSIRDGVTFVFREQLLLGSMALDLFAVFFGGATALLPVFATDVLHVGAEGFGLLRAAPAAGSLVAAVAAARFLPQRRAGWALHGVIAGFGVAMVVFGLSRSLPLSLLALVLAGLCDGTSVVIRRAILRLASPEGMRGRIAAVKSVFVGSSNEIGAFESGVAAHLLGTQAAVWSGGVATLLVVGVTAVLAPRLRRMDLRAMAGAPEVRR